tara:strand:- start:389 stop:2227 length:1839 start_codon:yes stop_codon:yes gene_type:complete
MSKETFYSRLFTLVGPVSIFTVLVCGGLLYSSFGGSARDGLVTQMLINAIIVLGIQIYVGNTGVLSFGHIGFGAIAGYAFAICAISPTRKNSQIPDAPFGLSGVDLTPFQSVLVSILITVIVAFIIGLGLARSGARSGSVAATVITLALLFVVHEVAKNWIDLTRGGKTGLSFSPLGNATLQGRGWIYIALLFAIISARLFKETRLGRLAQAAREDDLAARAVGIDPAVQQMISLLLSVTLVSMGASLRVFELGSINPRLFFFKFTLLTLTMLIVGGRNSVTGAIVGVVVITAGSEFTRYLAGPSVDVAALDWILRSGLTDIFLGASMLGFMIFKPAGLLGDWELDKWLKKFLPKKTTTGRSKPGLGNDQEFEHQSLNVEGVVVDFGGFRALDRAEIRAGTDEVVGLIGPNGAGKTTLLNVITGVVDCSEGDLKINGKSLEGLQPHMIARAGLVRTFQNLRLFHLLSVRENIEVARLASPDANKRLGTAAIEELIQLTGLDELRNRRAGELDYGNARRLELARAAAANPSFLLLDEPTSGMSDHESEAMVHQVRSVASLIGAGVVVIDHDLNFITGICDRVYVLDQGRLISTGSPEEISCDEKVRVAYLGSS